MKLHPLSDPWGPFSIRTIKYCNLSLSRFNDNKHCKCSEGPMLGLQGSMLSQFTRDHPRLKMAQSRSDKGTSEVKRAKN